MKPMTIVGAVLLVVGLVALAYGGIPYRSHETVLSIGDLHATADRQRTLELPSLLALAAAAGGATLLVLGLRKGV
jgi:hypothetical protein